MSFIWPMLLLLLVLVPVGIAIYVRIGRRRARAAAGYGSLGAGRVDVRRLGRRRFVPPTLMLIGVIVMFVALARPQATLSLPRLEGTVVLAFDVSGSMAATDFKPTRMEAAKAAARSFVKDQPLTVQIGVVAFSDSGVSIQAPTNDQSQVLAAIDRVKPQRGTSLGQGILSSLQAIATAENPNAGFYSNRSPDPSPSPVAAGTHGSAVVVLLSDGENNESPDPLAAAQTAADRGIRIYTVGVGSPGGVTLLVNGFQVHTQLDAALLQGVADTTGGTYFYAQDQPTLNSIYANLDSNLVLKPQATEITSIFAGVGLLALLLGSATSLAWLGRAP